jgi:hypothetical protein
MSKAVRVDTESTKLTAIDGTFRLLADSGSIPDNWRLSFLSLLSEIGLMYKIERQVMPMLFFERAFHTTLHPVGKVLVS